MVLKRQGYTLVELLVVIAIIAVMAAMMAGILNPGAMVDKAYDARRKKDINRIKVAFEEYFNDKGCYPRADQLGVCEEPWFSLKEWPCDPNGGQYKFVMENSTCPLTYIIVTNLKNLNDDQIPVDWYKPTSNYSVGGTAFTVNEVNFGVSSSNILWYQRTLPPHCIDQFGECHVKSPEGSCQAIPPGQVYLNTYTNTECSPECLVDCCYKGNLCNHE